VTREARAESHGEDHRLDPTAEPTATADVGEALVGVVETAGDRAERGRQLGRLTGALGRSARTAGGTAVLRGRWLTDVMLDVAPRIPVRSLATLRAHHGGLTGEPLADALVAAAAKATGTVGAAGGALAAVEWAAPPTLLSAPAQLSAETLAVAAIETKLLAELHASTAPPRAARRGSVRSPTSRRGRSVAGSTRSSAGA
jgi:hypothetical protein